MGRYYFALVFVLVCGYRTSASCDTPTLVTTPDFASVQACVSAVSSGQTVTISTGTATWTNTLSITKSLTLQVAPGATVTLTQGSSGNAFFLINTGNANTFVHISGDNGSASNCGATGAGCGLVLKAVNPAIDNADIVDVMGPIGSSLALSSTGFRLDHIEWSGGDAGLCTNCTGAQGSVYGVVDHSYLLNMGRAYFAQDRRTKDTGAGSSAWSDFLNNENTYAGNVFDFVTFENDLFDYNKNPAFNDGSDAQGSLYGQYGGKVVYRYNTIRNWGYAIDAHGYLDSSGYGTIMYDIYNNNISTSGAFSSFGCEGKEIYLRGGRYLIHDNNFGGPCQDTPVALIIYNGSADPDNQRIHDTFIWNNQQCDASMANCKAQNNSTVLSNESPCPNSPCLALNTNYFFRQPVPGDFGGLLQAYTSAIYPHPLVTGSVGVSPGSPTGLQVTNVR